MRSPARVALGCAAAALLAACSDRMVGVDPASRPLPAPPRADATGGGCLLSYATGASTGCAVGAQVSPASPFMRQSSLSPVQTGPITITFSQPVTHLRISGSGAISCNNFVGALVAYDAQGNQVERQDLTLIDPSDCGDDGVTFGAQASLSSTAPVAKVVIVPPSPFQFPVFDLTGNTTANYSLFFDPYAAGVSVALKSDGLMVHPAELPLPGLCTIARNSPFRSYTVTVKNGTDPSAQPVANRDVQLTLSAVDNSGGHVGHHGTRPVGSFSPTSIVLQATVTTDAAGTARFRYYSPEFGGDYVVTAKVDGGEGKDTVAVGVPLAALGAGHWEQYGGGRDVHPDVWYATATLSRYALALADSFHTRYGTDLGYNDMSLPRGGRFEIAGNWTDGDHCSHRWGNTLDLRSSGLDSAQVNYIRLKWHSISRGTSLYHSRIPGAPADHFHLQIAREF